MKAGSGSLGQNLLVKTPVVWLKFLPNGAIPDISQRICLQSMNGLEWRSALAGRILRVLLRLSELHPLQVVISNIR